MSFACREAAGADARQGLVSNGIKLWPIIPREAQLTLMLARGLLTPTSFLYPLVGWSAPCYSTSIFDIIVLSLFLDLL